MLQEQADTKSSYSKPFTGDVLVKAYGDALSSVESGSADAANAVNWFAGQLNQIGMRDDEYGLAARRARSGISTYMADRVGGSKRAFDEYLDEDAIESLSKYLVPGGDFESKRRYDLNGADPKPAYVGYDGKVYVDAAGIAHEIPMDWARSQREAITSSFKGQMTRGPEFLQEASSAFGPEGMGVGVRALDYAARAARMAVTGRDWSDLPPSVDVPTADPAMPMPVMPMFTDEKGELLDIDQSYTLLQDPARMRAIKEVLAEAQAKGELDPGIWDTFSKTTGFLLDFALVNKGVGAVGSGLRAAARALPVANLGLATAEAGAAVTATESAGLMAKPAIASGMSTVKQFAAYQVTSDALQGKVRSLSDAASSGLVGAKDAAVVLGASLAVRTARAGIMGALSKRVPSPTTGNLEYKYGAAGRAMGSIFNVARDTETMDALVRRLASMSGNAATLRQNLVRVGWSQQRAQMVEHMMDSAGVGLLFGAYHSAASREGWDQMSSTDQIAAMVEGLTSPEAIGGAAAFASSVAAHAYAHKLRWGAEFEKAPEAIKKEFDQRVENVIHGIAQPNSLELVDSFRKAFNEYRAANPEDFKGVEFLTPLERDSRIAVSIGTAEWNRRPARADEIPPPSPGPSAPPEPTGGPGPVPPSGPAPAPTAAPAPEPTPAPEAGGSARRIDGKTYEQWRQSQIDAGVAPEVLDQRTKTGRSTVGYVSWINQERRKRRGPEGDAGQAELQFGEEAAPAAPAASAGATAEGAAPSKAAPQAKLPKSAPEGVETVTVEEAAELMGIGTTEVAGLISDGVIASYASASGEGRALSKVEVVDMANKLRLELQQLEKEDKDAPKEGKQPQVGVLERPEAAVGGVSAETGGGDQPAQGGKKPSLEQLKQRALESVLNKDAKAEANAEQILSSPELTDKVVSDAGSRAESELNPGKAKSGEAKPSVWSVFKRGQGKFASWIITKDGKEYAAYRTREEAKGALDLAKNKEAESIKAEDIRRQNEALEKARQRRERAAEAQSATIYGWDEQAPRGAVGKKSFVVVAREHNMEPIPVEYELSNVFDLKPSHDPTKGYEPVEGADINERNYQHPTEGEQLRRNVEDISRDPNYNLFTTNTQSPTDGPSQTASNNAVLGGNARVMAVWLIYSRAEKPNATPEGVAMADRLREVMREEAINSYGIDRKAAYEERFPFIHRRVAQERQGKPGELSRILNDPLTAARPAISDSVSRGRKIDLPSMEAISEIVGSDSIRGALSDPSKRDAILNALIDTGAITWNDRSKIVKVTDVGGKRTETLTETGSALVEDLLLGAVVGDVEILTKMPSSVRGQFMSNLAAVTRIKAAWPEFSEIVSLAIDAVVAKRAQKAKTIKEAAEQETIDPDAAFNRWRKSPQSIALAEQLEQASQNELKTKLNIIGEVAKDVLSGQGNLFSGTSTETAEQAFSREFGANAASVRPSDVGPATGAAPSAAAAGAGPAAAVEPAKPQQAGVETKPGQQSLSFKETEAQRIAREEKELIERRTEQSIEESKDRPQPKELVSIFNKISSSLDWVASGEYEQSELSGISKRTPERELEQAAESARKAKSERLAAAIEKVLQLRNEDERVLNEQRISDKLYLTDEELASNEKRYKEYRSSLREAKRLSDKLAKEAETSKEFIDKLNADNPPKHGLDLYSGTGGGAPFPRGGAASLYPETEPRTLNAEQAASYLSSVTNLLPPISEHRTERVAAMTRVFSTLGASPAEAETAAVLMETHADIWAAQNKAQPQDWYRNRLAGVTADAPAGAPASAKGAAVFFEDGRAVIHAIKGSNIGTMLEELMHVWRRDLSGGAREVIEKWAGVKDGRWTVAAEEKFAGAGLRYLRTGKAPTRELQGVFAQAKNFMRKLFSRIRGTGLDVEMPSNVREAISTLFKLPPEVRDEVVAERLRKMTPESMGEIYRQNRQRPQYLGMTIEEIVGHEVSGGLPDIAMTHEMRVAQAGDSVMEAYEILRLHDAIPSLPYEHPIVAKSIIDLARTGGSAMRQHFAGRGSLDALNQAVDAARRAVNQMRSVSVESTAAEVRRERLSVAFEIADWMQSSTEMPAELAAKAKAAGLLRSNGKGIDRLQMVALARHVENQIAVLDAKSGFTPRLSRLTMAARPWIAFGTSPWEFSESPLARNFKLKRLVDWNKKRGFISPALMRQIEKIGSAVGGMWQNIPTTSINAATNKSASMHVFNKWDRAVKMIQARGDDALARIAARFGGRVPPRSHMNLLNRVIEGNLLGKMKGPQDFERLQQGTGYLFDVALEINDVLGQLGQLGVYSRFFAPEQIEKWGGRYRPHLYLSQQKEEWIEQLREGKMATAFAGRNLSRGRSPEREAQLEIEDPFAWLTAVTRQEGKAVQALGTLLDLYHGKYAITAKEYAEMNPYDRAAYEAIALNPREHDPSLGNGPALRNWYFMADLLQKQLDPSDAAPKSVELQKALMAMTGIELRDGKMIRGSDPMYVTRQTLWEMDNLTAQLFNPPQLETAMDSAVYNYEQATRSFRRGLTIGRPKHWTLNILNSTGTGHVLDRLPMWDVASSFMFGRGYYADSVRDILGLIELTRTGDMNKKPDGWSNEKWDRVQLLQEAFVELNGTTFSGVGLESSVVTDALSAAITPDMRSAALLEDLRMKGLSPEASSAWKSVIFDSSRRISGGMSEFDRRLHQMMGSHDPAERARAMANFTGMYNLWEMTFKWASALRTIDVQPDATSMSLKDIVRWSALGTADYANTSPLMRSFNTAYSTFNNPLYAKSEGNDRWKRAAMREMMKGRFWMYTSAMTPALMTSIATHPIRAATIAALTSAVTGVLHTLSTNDPEEDASWQEAVRGSVARSGMPLVDEATMQAYERLNLPAPAIMGWRPEKDDPNALRSAWHMMLRGGNLMFQAPSRGDQTRMSSLEELSPGWGNWVGYSNSIGGIVGSSTPAHKTAESIMDAMSMRGMELSQAVAFGLVNASNLAKANDPTQFNNTVKAIRDTASDVLPTISPFFIASRDGQRYVEVSALNGQTIDEWARGVIQVDRPSGAANVGEFAFSTLWRSQRLVQPAMGGITERDAMESLLRRVLPNASPSSGAFWDKQRFAQQEVHYQLAEILSGTYEEYLKWGRATATYDALLVPEMFGKNGAMERRIASENDPEIQTAMREYYKNFVVGSDWKDVVGQMAQLARRRAMRPDYFRQAISNSLYDPSGASLLNWLDKRIVREKPDNEALKDYAAIFFNAVSIPERGTSTRRQWDAVMTKLYEAGYREGYTPDSAAEAMRRRGIKPELAGRPALTGAIMER